jgi:uncharacterized membrane protein YqjE
LRGLSAATLGLVVNRVELASTELELAARLHVARLVWTLAGLLFGFLALIFGSVFVLVACWDTHRVAAAGALALGYGALGVAAWYQGSRLARRAPALLSATVAELKHDLAALRGSEP